MIPAAHRAGAHRRRAEPAARLRLLPARRAAGLLAAEEDRRELRVSAHPEAARAAARVRHRGQRPAQQGRRGRVPARQHRADVAELRASARAQRRDGRRRHGGPDRGPVPRRGHVRCRRWRSAAKPGGDDLVPHAGSAAADGGQSAQGVLLDVRPGRDERGARRRSCDTRQPARLRARVHREL